MKKVITALLIIYSTLTVAQPDSLSVVDRAMKEVKVEAKPVYIKAYMDVEKVRLLVYQAKQKIVKHSVVIDDYNDIFGSVLGKQTTLAGVEKTINEKGEAYIEIVYLKEQSRLLFLRAAEAKFKADNP